MLLDVSKTLEQARTDELVNELKCRESDETIIQNEVDAINSLKDSYEAGLLLPEEFQAQLISAVAEYQGHLLKRRAERRSKFNNQNVI